MADARKRRRILSGAGRDAAIRQVLYDLASLNHSISAMREVMAASLGVSPRQYTILLLLAEYQAEGGVTVRAVADHLHVSDAFVASEVAKLVESGLIERRPHPDDKRSQLLLLTDESSRRIAALRPTIETLNDEVFQSVPGPQFEVLAKSLETLQRDASAKAAALDLRHQIQARRRLRLAEDVFPTRAFRCPSVLGEDQ